MQIINLSDEGQTLSDLILSTCEHVAAARDDNKRLQQEISQLKADRYDILVAVDADPTLVGNIDAVQAVKQYVAKRVEQLSVTINEMQNQRKILPCDGQQMRNEPDDVLSRQDDPKNIIETTETAAKKDMSNNRISMEIDELEIEMTS